MKLKGYLSLFVLFAFLVTSCGGTPTQTPDSPNPNGPTPDSQNPNVNIDIQITTSELKEISVETISQPNCTGMAEVENVVEKSRTIEHVMEVQNGASVSATGQVGFAGTGVELGATVAAQFGQSYGSSDTITRAIIVKAPPGMNMQHVIRQMEVWQVGEAKITVGGQQTIIPFKFRSDFAIELAQSNKLPCGTEETTPLIPITNDPTAAPTVGLPTGMDVQLVADITSGKAPLNVHFDARNSFFRDAQGDIFNCGVCNYTWYVYNSDFTVINDPKRSSNGTFSFKFGKGDYRVVVKVCRGQGETDCAYGAEEISAK